MSSCTASGFLCGPYLVSVSVVCVGISKARTVNMSKEGQTLLPVKFLDCSRMTGNPEIIPREGLPTIHPDCEGTLLECSTPMGRCS